MIPRSIPFADQGRALDVAMDGIRRRRAKLSKNDLLTIAALEAARVALAQLTDMAAATSDSAVEILLAKASSTARSERLVRARCAA